MVIAYSYKRVSSQEQKENKNSITEQENRINKFAKEKNIQIIRKFEDSNSAFHDNDRSLWIICENAHPSIITKEECQQAIEKKEKRKNKYKYLYI